MFNKLFSLAAPSSQVLGRKRPIAAVFLVITACLATQAVAQVESLTLRINDMQAEPGGLVAIVVRTYASRPITQGQLCLRALPSRSGAAQSVARGVSPFTSIEDWKVFSSQGDAAAAVSLQNGNQIDIDFSSITSSINDSDGPMLVIYARLDPSLPANTELEITLDGLGTAVFETIVGVEQEIPTRLRPGTLTIVNQGAPLELTAESEDAEAGTTARLAIGTARVLPWTSGHLEFSYPVAIADGLPTVAVDPRYGTASLVALHPSPGVVAIDFQSLDQSLNYLPGDVLQINLPLNAKVIPGTYPISIDPLTAEVRDSNGQLVGLEFDVGGVLEVVNATLFADGFESGDLSNWEP